MAESKNRKRLFELEDFRSAGACADDYLAEDPDDFIGEAEPEECNMDNPPGGREAYGAPRRGNPCEHKRR